MKRFLFIEPYHGGSHREFAEGLQKNSSHHIDILSLPDRNWQWRLSGSALYFARQGIRFEDYDGIIVSGLLRLSDLKALGGKTFPPVLVYFHETQLTYPASLNQDKGKGPENPMADISTALCADLVAFNSGYHRDAFLKAIPEFMERVPDYPLDGVAEDIGEKSRVLYPGVDLPESAQRMSGEREPSEPLVIWNHRWNYDKNAPSFFYAAETLMKAGIDFKLAILGECPGKRIPETFIKARETFGPRIVQFGYAPDRKTYFTWLEKGSMVVSTARQENFGMSMVEAMACGCLPLLPERLSYPEILPERFHDLFLYRNQKELITKFRNVLGMKHQSSQLRKEMAKAMELFSWKSRISQYDGILEHLSRKGR